VPGSAAAFASSGGAVAVAEGAASVLLPGVVSADCVDGVGGCAAAAAGSATGVPIWSETTAVSAKGSFGFVLPAAGDGAICECVSLITGTCRTTRRAVLCVTRVLCVTVVGAAIVVCACVSGGSAGSL
jgi:hypothetical protein